MMRSTVLTVAAALSVTVAAIRAQARVETVEETPGSLTLDVRFGAAGDRPSVLAVPGYPPLRYERFYVAVPEGGGVSIEYIEGSFEDRAGELPARRPDPDSLGLAPEDLFSRGFFPPEAWSIEAPSRFRRTRLLAVNCFAEQVDYSGGVLRAWSGYRVRIVYPPIREALAAEQADPLVASLVKNRLYVPAPVAPEGQAAAAPDPHFSLSMSWVKFRIASPGVYAISGSDLVQAGVNLAAIGDPESFRLFTSGGREQSRFVTGTTGTWVPGNWMKECAILVEYGGDTSFDPQDRIILFALGVEGYEDLYSPGASRDAYVRHSRARENFYYLTWDGSFPGSPARMAPVDAAPTAGPDVTTFEERLHFEQDRVENFNFGGDGWLWLDITEKPGPETITLPSFVVTDLDPTRPQSFRTLALAPVKYGTSNANHHVRYLINRQQVAEITWDAAAGLYADGRPVAGTGFFLREGLDTLRLQIPRDLNPRDFMYFSHYQVWYGRFLRGRGDRLLFTSPDTTGVVSFALSNYSTTGPMYVFDVTDALAPRQLVGFAETVVGTERRVRFASTVNSRRTYWAGTNAGLAKPAGLTRYFPRDLRDVTTSPHMIIVTPPAFTGPAQTLRNHRANRLPYFTSPRVEVVTTTEIFDNFSGGLPDPMAIRNYCKFLYDNFSDTNGAPLLTFLLLLGDANSDFKNIKTAQPDYVTSNLNLNPCTVDAYVTDELYARMDSTESSDPIGTKHGDIAVGRLPAGSLAEAQFLVDRMIAYETQRDFGSWRDRVILVSDDEKSRSGVNDDQFIAQSETIARSYMPSYMDARKVYLTEFPLVGSIKPAGRLAFLDAWNDGALVVNYIGHGSSLQMADEQVFLQSDVGNLVNGLRLPLFLGMSCTIGDFATAQAKSLSERLLLRDGGGIVAAITASQLSYISVNATLDYNVYREMFPAEPGLSEALGVALVRAKNLTIFPGYNGACLADENNQKYNLLGDPALRLLIPAQSIVFEPGSVDTFVTGTRQTISGRVFKDGSPDLAFDGRVELTVREPDDQSGYAPEVGPHINYNYPGGTVYRGTADVRSGEFEFSIKLPRFARVGPLGYVLAYADDGVRDAAARQDQAFFVDPSPGDTTALKAADGPPRVELGFKGGLTTVKPGAVLQARVRDADGVNVLSTTPEGKLALVFDDTNLPVNVTEFFRFDHGGSDTSGVLEFPIPELPVGSHRAVFKVSDSFGQTRLDTLAFVLTDPLDYSAEIVYNYPNPFETSTYFLLKLTEPASVRLEIFTVSGKRIRKLEQRADTGEAWILWDGRDSRGDGVANGTYLYVARVHFEGLDRAPVVLRGAVVKIE